MAQYRQTGTERFTFRNSHEFHGVHQHNNDNGAVSDQISIRVPHKHPRLRRSAKNQRRISVAAIAVILSVGVIVTFFSFQHLTLGHRGIPGSLNGQDDESKHGVHLRPKLDRSTAFKKLEFGKGSTKLGGDSRYWDRDDRRRDDDYDRDILELSGVTTNGDHVPKTDNTENMRWASRNGREDSDEKEKLKHGSEGLYNEVGRNELKKYEDKYEASLNNGDQSGEQGNQDEDVNLSDEYDDGIDIDDAHLDWSDELDRVDEDHPDEALGNNSDGVTSSNRHDGGTSHSGSQRESGTTARSTFTDSSEKHFSSVSHKSSGNTKLGQGNAVSDLLRATSSGKKSGSKRKPKQRKFSGSSCEMKFLNSTHELVEPVETKRFSRFSLQYTDAEDRPNGIDTFEPRFAGHQSLQEREDSFYARNQRINCGFVKGPNGSPSTGFDLAEDDVRYMSSCHIAVSSCIFGNSDHLRTPYGKTITRSSRKNVCFVMFVDDVTLQTLSSEGQKTDRMGFIGLWRIVVVKNLPFTDMRRVGKIPKFLTHRLFPSARYSIWLDSKLRLQSDPFLILEYFLWRKGYEYAISNHYDRHCVWEEVIQNKKLNKFNHTVIDQQFTFYQADGLRRFDPSDANRLLPSYVPEGSFIIRAHTPMSNLFSCLWFNEVDRFTPRDQLSFAYTYLKLRRMNPEKPFRLNMFKDCERRSIAKLFHHRAEDKRNIQMQATG